MHQPINCPDCSGRLHLTEKPQSWRGKSQYVYLCENRPQCRGLMSAHPDGRPLGTPMPAGVRRARRLMHEIFDPLWMNAQDMYSDFCAVPMETLQRIARNRTYAWLSAHTGIPEKQCHMGKMTLEQLRHAWLTIKKYNPTPESIRAWAKEKKAICTEETIRA